MTTMVERMVIALRDEAKTFRHPVRLYVEDEARWRWEDANPDKDGHFDGPAGIDWELESWKILVRAVMQAMRESLRDALAKQMCRSDGFDLDADPNATWDPKIYTDVAHPPGSRKWHTYQNKAARVIDAALKEGE